MPGISGIATGVARSAPLSRFLSLFVGCPYVFSAAYVHFETRYQSTRCLEQWPAVMTGCNWPPTVFVPRSRVADEDTKRIRRVPRGSQARMSLVSSDDDPIKDINSRDESRSRPFGPVQQIGQGDSFHSRIYVDFFSYDSVSQLSTSWDSKEKWQGAFYCIQDLRGEGRLIDSLVERLTLICVTDARSFWTFVNISFR